MWTLAITATTAWAAPVSVADVPNPRALHDGWVTDLAGVLDADDEAALEQRLDALHRDLTVELAVVTVGDVDAPTPRDVAAWRPGVPPSRGGRQALRPA